jgi:hypothetical protein
LSETSLKESELTIRKEGRPAQEIANEILEEKINSITKTCSKSLIKYSKD